MHDAEKDRIDEMLRAGRRAEAIHEMEAELSNRVYAAAVGVYEHAEHRNLTHGNGHHQAQDLAEHAIAVLRRHLTADHVPVRVPPPDAL